MQNWPRTFFVTCVVWLCATLQVQAQVVRLVNPRTVKLGGTTQLKLHGSDLNDSLRIACGEPAISWKVEKIEPTYATVALTVSEACPPGPVELWLKTEAGVLKLHHLYVDALDSVLDNAQNSSLSTAQSVSTPISIEGYCNASLSDFYRFHASAGERIAVEIQTQQLRSAMDPVVRLLDSNGVVLIQGDDSLLGPDCKFSHVFKEAGDYFIEVFDSRHAAGGAAYQLRLGDFPIVNQCYPPAVRTGEKTMIGFVGPDGAKLPSREFDSQATSNRVVCAQAQFEPGKPANWVPLLVSSLPQFVESDSKETISLPVGISGRLGAASEVDNYSIRGTKGQVVRFAAATRTLGSPTVLQMRLFNAAGNKISEAKVSDADEWSFDATLPEDGDYRLEASDLLRRGGEEFTYYIACTLPGSFSVGIKADAKAREEFLIEPGHGACVVTLQVARFGYDGEIEIALADAKCGLKILNPRIPAKATEAKLFLQANADWKPDSIHVLQFIATAVENPAIHSMVDSVALRRVKEPYIVVPSMGANGRLVFSAGKPTSSPFQLEPAAPVVFARPTHSHTATLALKRVQEKFKAPVEVLSYQLLTGWSATTQVEQDKYTVKLTRSAEGAGEPAELQLPVYGEHEGRGRIEVCSVPIQWIDPVRVSMSFPKPLIKGGKATGLIQLQRAGDDPQAVTIAVEGLPNGIACASPISIAADQNQAEVVLEIATDAAIEIDRELTLKATSKFDGQEFSLTSKHPVPKLVESPSSVMVFPGEIILDDPRGRQQFVIFGEKQDGGTRDWTRDASVSSANPNVAAVRDGVVYPVADGETELVVAVGSNRKAVPIRVTNRATNRPLGFESEVLVALSKQGCNSGACHGSPSGKGGFRLSLRAFDMKLDEFTLVQEELGRRVNTLEPAESLLLLKPLMSVSHGGGKQIRKSDVTYAILQDWIAAGAATDPQGTPRIVKLELFPHQKQILSVEDGPVQFAVTAIFADGRKRDVTHLAAYETSDTAVASVDVNGLVTPKGRGEVAILVRVLEYIESVPIMFVEKQKGFDWKAPAPNNYVDELVYSKLKQLQFQPAELCTDEEFLRRVSLDLIGLLPTPEESIAFLEDQSKDKRQKLIDSLLQRDEYAKFWALKWGDLLRMTRKLVGDEGVYKYHRWLEDSLHENMPYDEFARQLLTGTGSTLANPPANFYRTSTDMNECVETISQVFLGARLQCAKCHNHPFERWTQDNYYGLGAFFNRVQRRKTGRPGELFVYFSGEGDVVQPRTGEVMAPWLPQQGSVQTVLDADRRQIFADWLVKADNPYFARIEANRIWSQLFARGIVDPIDDFRDSNPPSNAALLDALAKDFVESGYDRKHLLRVILNSRTYQSSCQTSEFNQSDDRYFSHQEPRLLGAEQLLDAINRTLAIEQKLGNLPPGTLATHLPAPDVAKVDFLKVFGQPERSTVCACERGDDSNLGMAIELFNGPMLHEKLRDPNNRFRKLLTTGKSVEETLQDVYLAALCRRPTEVELKVALQHCSKNSDPVVGIEDVCWALFNTDEFLFQH